MLAPILIGAIAIIGSSVVIALALAKSAAIGDRIQAQYFNGQRLSFTETPGRISTVPTPSLPPAQIFRNAT